MIDYLAEFYQGRETPFDARLIFSDVSNLGTFRVKSFGGSTVELLTPEQQAIKLELYRKEMDNFAQFLKKKFIEQ